MRRSVLILPAVLTILTSCTGNHGSQPPPCIDGYGCSAAGGPAPLSVELTAAQVIAGSVAAGAGMGEFEIDRDTGGIRGSVTFDGLEPTAVSLNRGFAGERGPVLVWLAPNGATRWSLPPSAVLGRSDIDALDAGGLYLEATSAQSSTPAVRGQIVRQSGVEVRFVHFSAAQVVPMGGSAATAIGAMTIDTVDSGIAEDESFVLHVNSAGLNDITAVDAHIAAAGVNGPVIENLMRDPDAPSHWVLKGSFHPAEEMRKAFDQSTLYVDFHTAAHPDGEIRGQLGRENTSFLSLDGGDEVPPVDTANWGVAAMTTRDYVGWDWRPNVEVHVNLAGIDDATAVTLNYAALGQNGQVVHSLSQNLEEPSQWSIMAVTLESSNSLPAEGWYVNVTTPRFPGGEVRGQIETGNAFTVRAPDAFAVTAVHPADGATINALPSTITVDFNRNLLADSAIMEHVKVLASGGDASFTDGNEVEIRPIAVTISGPSLTIDLTDVPWQDDTYQLTVAPLADSTGTRLESEFFSTFVIDSQHRPPTFQQVQDTLFTPSCAKAGCHRSPRPPRGLDLSSGVAFRNIVNVPSAEAPGIHLIEPADPDSSYLLSRVTWPTSRTHTPGEPALSNSMTQMLREWIADGAKNN